MKRGRLRRLFAASVLLAASGLAASTPARPAEDLAAAAIRVRAAGDYKTAIDALEQLVVAWPDRTDFEILLAETLAWDKRFGDAETHYRHALEREPGSHAAQLGLARVLVWVGRYADAEVAFDRLLREHAADTDALEGRGTAEYWSGDTRSAARDFRRALALDPQRPFSRRSLGEIGQASAAEERISLGYLDDDQPYRLVRGEVKSSVFSDPLTRWSAAAGSYRGRAPVFGTALMPFLLVSNETVIPPLRLTVAPSLGLVRYADGAARPVGGLSLSLRISKPSSIVLRAERTEILVAATGMTTHPSLTSFSAGWRRESLDGWIAAAEAATLRYFDANRGVSAFAYGLAPVWRRGSSRLFCGASATYRDSRESRFGFAAVSSARTGDQFDYAYRGVYAPYWAPQDFREARAVVVAQTTVHSLALKLQADAGIGYDRATAFGPPSGPTPLPPAIYSFDFRRRFHPYRMDLTASVPVTDSLSAEIGFQTASTVFYRAKAFHASVVRHR